MTDGDIADFLNGKIGSISKQLIKFFDIDILDEGIFSEDLKVKCYTLKFGGNNPGTVYYGLEEV